MAISKANLLQNIFTEAETPYEIQHLLVSVLGINSVAEFIEYVVRANYQEEWRQIVSGAFPYLCRRGRQGSD